MNVEGMDEDMVNWVRAIERAQRMDATLAKALPMAKPGSWGCVQSHEVCVHTYM